jgi:hypothetical protein
MNIFVLSENPEIAASYHCDQHLHKMILESAQMLSTWAYKYFPKARSYVYKPAYENHPCTKWIDTTTDNRIYLILLARELENIRQSLGYPEHSASKIVEIVADITGHDDFPHLYSTPKKFIFAGPPTIAISSKLSITEKYQKYYRQKHQQWLLDKGAGMSYKGRPVPDFMSDLIN